MNTLKNWTTVLGISPNLELGTCTAPAVAKLLRYRFCVDSYEEVAGQTHSSFRYSAGVVRFISDPLNKYSIFLVFLIGKCFKDNKLLLQMGGSTEKDKSR